MKKVLWPIFKFFRIDSLYLLAQKSDLKERGWFKSYRKKMSIDKYGNPLPWFTYPSIDFLETKLDKEMEVFEYGCGNLTLWLAKKTKHITSVEHDKRWYEKIKKELPENTTLLYKQLGTDEYIKSVGLNNKQYDVIIIDGRNRNKCMKEVVKYLKDDGFIILDNSEREIYQDGIKFLKKSGFKEVSFNGMGPINVREWSTSIFYH